MIKIGTRASKLALWQAYHVKDLLTQAGLDSQIIEIITKGDKILDRSLSKIGSKGLFTEEIEEQLLNGRIDIAVHSAKDLQSDLGEHFEILAFLEREKANDVLLSDKKIDLNSKLIVGTSSTRRVAMLKANYPHWNLVDMRGNLQTRIQKLKNGDCDAIMLAYAGVHRMEYNSMIKHEFDASVFVPPVGQGSVAIEVSKSLDLNLKAKLKSILNHNDTELCLMLERAYLKQMQGGCSIPSYAHASLASGKIHVIAGIMSLNGEQNVKVEDYYDLNSEVEKIGTELANRILDMGGKEILNQIKQQQ